MLRKNGGPLIKIIGLSLNYQQPKALKRTKWKMFPLFNKIPKLNKNTVDETLNIYNILYNTDVMVRNIYSIFASMNLRKKL